MKTAGEGMTEPVGGWIPDKDWKEPSSIIGSVEECRAKLREHLAEASKDFRRLYRRELGTVEMTVSTAEACGITVTKDGWGEFEGTEVRVRSALRARIISSGLP